MITQREHDYNGGIQDGMGVKDLTTEELRGETENSLRTVGRETGLDFFRRIHQTDILLAPGAISQTSLQLNGGGLENQWKRNKIITVECMHNGVTGNAIERKLFALTRLRAAGVRRAIILFVGEGFYSYGTAQSAVEDIFTMIEHKKIKWNEIGIDLDINVGTDSWLSFYRARSARAILPHLHSLLSIETNIALVKK